MNEFCNDCRLPIPPCGWGDEFCNSDRRAEGIVNKAFAAMILKKLVGDPMTGNPDSTDQN